jgi:hypothetical protein
VRIDKNLLSALFGTSLLCFTRHGYRQVRAEDHTVLTGSTRFRRSYFGRTVALPVEHRRRFENVGLADVEANAAPLDALTQFLKYFHAIHDTPFILPYPVAALLIGNHYPEPV